MFILVLVSPLLCVPTRVLRECIFIKVSTQKNDCTTALLFPFVVCQETTVYRAFHGIGRAKFAYGGLILGSRQFTLLPQLPLKTMLNLKGVKIKSKTIILLH